MSGKKGKLLDRIMTVVLILFAVGVIATIAAVVIQKMPKKTVEKKTETASGSAAEEEEEVDEKYITRYSCVISEGNESEDSGSIFYLELNEKDGTYKEYLKAGSEKSEINSGTFTRTEDAIETVNKDKKKNTLYYEGKYLISKNAIYDGEVPETKTFKRTFVSEVSDESKVEIKFKKDGTFTQNIVRYSANLDGSDTTNAAEGTYKRKGNFIERKKSDGEKMLSLYVYKNQLCTSYYKLESEATEK